MPELVECGVDGVPEVHGDEDGWSWNIKYYLYTRIGTKLKCMGQLVSRVTRWLEYLFTLWLFRATQICIIE